MSDFNWCHGPSCHKKHTVDRVRGVKGSKVLRTRKIPTRNRQELYWYDYFCSQNCYNEDIETFYYGFYLELKKIAKKKEEKNERL